MSQTYLDENPPMILDATCSDRKIWPRSASVRIDIRREASPDILASATALPFRSGTFDIIYCDPPHLIRSSPIKPTSIYSKHSMSRFSLWPTKGHWLKFVYETNREFAHAIKTSGQLQYKLSEAPHDTIKYRDMTHYSSFSESKQRRRPSGSHWTKGETIFLTMKPKPEGKGQPENGEEVK